MDSAVWRVAAGRTVERRHAVRVVTDGQNWLLAIRRYMIAMTAGNLVWEVAQLPLYTVWRRGTPSEMAAAAFHCLLGDLVIASVTLTFALALFGTPTWPHEKFWTVGSAVILGGVGYTIYSEYANTVLRVSWAYSAWMPTLPVFGTGIAPLVQWLVVPALALTHASSRLSVNTLVGTKKQIDDHRTC
jgi:hypothetical protein